MPKARKKSVRPELVRKGKKGPAKLEPLHPKPDLLDKSSNDLTKFPDENPYPVLRIHKNGTVLFANKASEPLLKARSSGAGRSAPAEWRRLAKKALSSGQVIREVTEHDGRIFAFRVVPISNNIYVNFYGVDITERKQAEEALQTSEEKFRTLADQSFDSIVIHEGGVIIEANKTFGEKWGYKPEETVGLEVEQLIAPESLEMVKENIRCGYDKPYGAVAVRKNGRRFTIEIIGKPLTYKGRTMRIATARDITERKKAELALWTSEEQYKTILQTTMNGFWLLDMQGHIIEVNDSYCQISGYRREELLKMSIAQLEAVETPEDVAQHIQKIITHGADRFETAHRHKNGNIFQVEASIHFLPKEAGRFFCFFRDITEQKQAEHKLVEYQKQLKKLAAQLALTEERERRRIARNLHDQVNQSLALAKIKLDAMQASEKASPLAETLKDTNDTIEKAIRNTRSLTFDLSYPTLYELGFEAAVAEWLQEQVQKKHGIITQFLDDGLPKPLDDDVRVLLFRNIRELLINIIKHARADKVKVSIAKTDDSIKVKIEDNGVGLNVDEITASRKGGFGLFSIRESIGELGGSFVIESKPGAGCKVTMIVPLKRKRIDDERNKATHQGNGN